MLIYIPINNQKKNRFPISIFLFSDFILVLFNICHVQLFSNIANSIFIDTSGPTMSEMVGSVSLILILQYFWAYLTISISTFFISYMGLNWLKNPNYKNIFILLSLIFFYILPILSLFSGNFALTPERSFAYYSILSIFIISVGISKITEFKIQKRNSIFNNNLFCFRTFCHIKLFYRRRKYFIQW